MRDRHIIVTGGSTGIGFAIAAKLIESGFTVHITGRRRDVLRAAAETLGPRAIPHPGDIGSAEDRKALVAAVGASSGGRLHSIVLNAAVYRYQPLLETSDEAFENDYRINVLGPFALVRDCHEMLKAGDGKAVLFISSTLGSRPVPNAGAYAATKAALNSLTISLALEWAPDRIRVNAVLPGVVDTPIHDPVAKDDPSRTEKMAAFAEMHPIGRVGDPADVASAAFFLLSEDAGWVTGTLMNVDGGISIA